jgi:hypothetical protein
VRAGEVSPAALFRAAPWRTFRWYFGQRIWEFCTSGGVFAVVSVLIRLNRSPRRGGALSASIPAIASLNYEEAV